MTDQTATSRTEADHTPDAEKKVIRNDEAGRYEIFVGGALAGFTEIEPDGQGRVVFPHTEVDSDFAGMGLSKILVREALTDTARRGESIVPLCSVVRKYLRENEVPGAVVEWPERPGARDSDGSGEPTE